MTKLLLLLSLLFSLSATAQKGIGTVRGTLQDGGKQPLPEATISVMKQSDSTLLSFSLTSNSGYFEIKNLDTGAYYLLASYQGLEPVTKNFTITIEGAIADVGAVVMEKSYKTMAEVIIKDVAPVKIKGDTLAYNADAFKTKPDATVEDLLKKLPGMQVEKDGTVKAQGEQVQKIYVDGKEFFSNGPKLATKNITADMIDQVEVYDDVSEQSRFNKIDDGSRSKAINLKLKKDKKKGTFGRASAGYGTDDRYDNSLTANYFKGTTQVALIAKANNTNNIGFTITDAIGIMGSGGNNNGGANRGGGNTGMAAITGGLQTIGVGGNGGFTNGTTGNGITSSAQAGLNFRDVWGKKLQVNGSYFYNRTGNNNLRSAYRQTFLTDSTINRSSRTNSQTNNGNHRVNFNLVWELDSLNSIIYNPNINLQSTTSFRDDTLTQFAEKGTARYLLSNTHNVNTNEGEANNWTNNLTWRRRLNKPGRTLSVALNNTISTNDRDGFVTSTNRFFNAAGTNTRINNFRQNNIQDVSTNNYGGTVSYTEPLSRNKIWEVNYNYSKNKNESNRQTWDYNSASDKYDRLNTLLSNHFRNENTTHRAGTNFRVTQKKYNYQVGVSVQNTELDNYNITRDSTLKQRFVNLFPRANFNYQFSRSKNLRLNYNGRTNQPSINQLQNVEDRTNAPNMNCVKKQKYFKVSHFDVAAGTGFLLWQWQRLV